MMDRTTIIFQTDSKTLPTLILECEYTAWSGSPQTWESPAEPAGVEVSEVLCLDIDDAGCRPFMEDILKKVIGALCWQADRKQIERLVMEGANEEAQGDPDRYRD
jgi:hypothetical protein